MDPSLADGFQVIYEREIPLELRCIHDSPLGPTHLLLSRLQELAEETQEVGTLESIKTKILMKVGDD